MMQVSYTSKSRRTKLQTSIFTGFRGNKKSILLNKRGRWRTVREWEEWVRFGIWGRTVMLTQIADDACKYGTRARFWELSAEEENHGSNRPMAA
jgi:hypothetical protein